MFAVLLKEIPKTIHNFSTKFTEFLKKLSYISLNLTDRKLYRMILQQQKYKRKRKPRRRRNFFQNLTWNYILYNRFFEKFAKIFLNGAFGAEFWALRAQNLAPQSPKYWGDRFSTVVPILGGTPRDANRGGRREAAPPPINDRLLVSLSPQKNGGWGSKIFGTKRPKFGAEGAV